MNLEVYKTSLQHLTAGGVPQDIAEKASIVVAKDDPHKPDLGRSSEDQQAVNQAMEHYHRGQTNAQQ
ncbi:hypothetical protein [Halotia branconii]|uniref:Uncharacterized protein n=1 Tax=Halotia branconii CENA392 TaxID=1539056 RepID=A0AAJ6NT58_9CYAN|nr:hypothetical protein [Halotia branconii]WGV23459.1 hypothetical protein QI031_16675 [Halotia branconii CENA392]WGV25938.1 hypothetical protein QI031_30250 [Halotia branconii CENA392]WGV25954.1 hypothetical protein QI031_00060 [Halotia branconii CENA392]